MKLFWGLFMVVAVPTFAQQPEAGAYATVDGVAVDSLQGGALSGAIVGVVGTARMAVSDSLGRFRIDSVPPGMHAVEMSHAILDTLGLRVRTQPLEFRGGSITQLAVGIPSAKTILRAKCGPSSDGSAALMGMVIEADSEDAVAGAQVQLAWVETVVSREVGVRRDARQRSATTDAAGRYRICDLAPDLEAELLAKLGQDSTAVVTVRLGQAVIGMATLFISTRDSTPVAAGNVPAGAASVRGTVVDSAGRPLAGVRVGFTSSPDAAVTDSAGAFSLTGQQSGTQVLTARRIGYQPAEMVVNLTRREPREVVMRLEAYVPVLEAVYVEARRNAGWQRVGFADRQRSGFGRYLTQSDLEKRHAIVVSDFLRHLPPARASGMSNRACTTFWVDGNRWHGDPTSSTNPSEGYDVDYFVAPSEVAAIEVYGSTSVPAEFQSFDGGCRVVVIWTKWKLGIR